MNSQIIILFIILMSIFVIYNNNKNTKDKLIENYSPIIYRYQNATLDQNTCPKPFTNSKRDTTCSKPVYTYQYANRMLVNPNDYNIMVTKVLNDLVDGNEDLSLFSNDNLEEKNYNGDQDQFTNFLNAKLKKLAYTKDYLQNNGSWKYEYFFTSEPTIYFYKVKNSDLYLFKITFTLENPLRSSYTNCYAFISLKNPIYNNENGITNNPNNLKILKSGIVSMDSIDIDKFKNQPLDYMNSSDALNKIPKGDLNYTFLNVMPELEFDQWGDSVNNSGISYISEFRQGDKVNVKPEIPDEFKNTKEFKTQYLPPEFGNGICDYPPIYKLQSGKDKNGYYLNNPPLTNDVY